MYLDQVSINNIPLGTRVRGQVNHEWIFRVRRGNGYFETIEGKLYQDKYAYFVPDSINNPEGQPARDALSQAVNEWKTTLTPAQKQEYNERAEKMKGLAGYHLYLRERIKEILS